MKAKAAVVLAALFLSLASPVSLHMSSSDGAPILVALDVCNTAGAALSVNADIPVIQECPCKVVPPAFSGYINISNPEYYLLMLTSKQERPPEA